MCLGGGTLRCDTPLTLGYVWDEGFSNVFGPAMLECYCRPEANKRLHLLAFQSRIADRRDLDLVLSKAFSVSSCWAESNQQTSP